VPHAARATAAATASSPARLSRCVFTFTVATVRRPGGAPPVPRVNLR
jgi:hypothetical protein